MNEKELKIIWTHSYSFYKLTDVIINKIMREAASKSYFAL